MRNFTIIFFLPMLFLANCTTFNTSVNSISLEDDFSGINVFIGPGNENVNINDIQFREYAKKLSILLSSKNFNVVDDLNIADQVILLTYGVSAPISQTASIPQFGKTGIASSTTYGTINTYNKNQSTYTGTTTNNYNYGITGVANINYVVYTSFLIITAYDYKVFLKSNSSVQMWQTEVTSTSNNNDLRVIFPYLLLASEKYVAKNTNKIIKESVNSNDSRLKKYYE